MDKRGVLYVYWGGSKQERFLERSVQSLFEHHPELPVQIEKLPDNATLLDKSGMFELSRFEETLFLDIDTVVLGNLSGGDTPRSWTPRSGMSRTTAR